jgi:uncharacterized protein (DUF2237 family)
LIKAPQKRFDSVDFASSSFRCLFDVLDHGAEISTTPEDPNPSMREIIFIRRTLLLFTLLILSTSNAYQNVYGNELQPCSTEGMALTGYTRNGYCIDQNDDEGSHHVCIDLASTSGGNFCSVTGQSDWCSDSMSCVEDTSRYCPVQNWCVCQWAFASYIENAGGCDQIQDIACESINQQTIVAYQKQLSSTKYRNALKCLVNRCSLDSSVLVASSDGTASFSSNSIAEWLLGGAVMVSLAFWLTQRRRRRRGGYGTVPDNKTKNLMDSNDGKPNSVSRTMS